MKLLPNKKHFKGFTLVELIIVITILGILATIAYISFQGYTKDARDGIRMSDIKQIYNGLSIYKTQTEKVLMSDNYINIQSGTTTISYQGYAGASVLRTLRISGGKDPGTKDYYIYTTDVNTKKAQLMTYMETSDKDVQLLSQLKDLNIINQANAVTNTGYYQDKKIYVYGDKIGILTNNKVPLQETTTSTGIDITSLTGSITTYFGGNVYSGGLSTNTGLTLINQINGAITGKLPCSPTTYDNYTITSLQDTQSGSFTKPLTIENGSGTGTIVATCNNGVLSYGEENTENGCSNGYSLIGGECIINKFNLSGNITNGSGGTINLCGTSTSINSSGNFTLSNINNGTNCSSITLTKNLYNCSISIDGPSNLTSNVNNISGSCSLQYLDVANSLRFDSTRSTYLTKPPGTSGDRIKNTRNLWIKNNSSSGYKILIGAVNGGRSDWDDAIGFLDNKITILSGNITWLTTSNTFFSTSFYALTVSLDTTQPDATKRLRLYINGVEITSFSVDNRSSITMNQDWYSQINSSSSQSIGRWMAVSSGYFDGYLSEINFVDGSSLGPENFGLNIGGKWMPKAYTGSYGTNGFHLNFSDNSNLGKDISGRNNNWISNNFQTYDQVTDSPTR